MPTDNIRATIGRLETKLDTVSDSQTKMIELLTGNGDPETGLIVKVDRLIQDKERRDRTMGNLTGVAWTALASGLVGLGGLIWGWIARK